MTSRHLYFKLLLEDLKRKTWAAALEGLALFFALPVALAMTLSNITNELYGDMTLVRGQAQARTMLEFGNDYPVIMLILGIAAVVMGISAFSYLQNRRQVDFYHSLPVKRELQFFLDHKVPQVKFVDRTFNCRHEHAMEIWKYILEHDNPIKDGETVDGVADGQMSREIQWKCQYEDALIQPPRGVLDIHMGEFAAGQR